MPSALMIATSRDTRSIINYGTVRTEMSQCYLISIMSIELVSSGFFVPPVNQLQTASISKDVLEGEDILENWHLSLSRVEPFTKFIYRKEDIKKTDKGELSCQHRYQDGDTLWLSKKTHDTFCNKCATLLQFSECIRKYVC